MHFCSSGISLKMEANQIYLKIKKLRISYPSRQMTLQLFGSLFKLQHVNCIDIPTILDQHVMIGRIKKQINE